LFFTGSLLICRQMHPLFKKASGLTDTIIAAAIEVHRDKGPGLIESHLRVVFDEGTRIAENGIISQKSVVIEYKGFTREEPLRFDVLVEGCVLVEAKAVEKVAPVHKGQASEVIEAAQCPLGLLITSMK